MARSPPPPPPHPLPSSSARLQISEQEIKDSLALTMKHPPTQAEVAAVVRCDGLIKYNTQLVVKTDAYP